MAMTNMKRTKAELKEREKGMNKPCSIGGEVYGYGLRVSLDGLDLQKLGLKPKDFDIGDTVKIEAIGKVVNISANSSERGENYSRVELQLVQMELDNEKTLGDAVSDGIDEADEE